MEVDLRAVVDETIEFVTVERAHDGRLTGDAPDWFGDRLFGGFVVAQAMHAAITHVAPADGKRLHSLHGYFLRPVFAGKPVSYDIEALKEGRTFGVHRVDATQDGAIAFTMTCSFTADVTSAERPVYEYELPADAAATAATSGDEADLDQPRPGDDAFDPQQGPGPCEQMWLGPT